MAADTTLSITQIELGLAQYFNFRNNVIVPNVSWGLLNHEADLLILNKSGYLTEIEIKRSWADFLADFRKRHTHEDTKVSWHYYAVPESIVDKCREKLNISTFHSRPTFTPLLASFSCPYNRQTYTIIAVNGNCI